MSTVEQAKATVDACAAALASALDAYGDCPTPPRAADVDHARKSLDGARRDLELAEAAEAGRARAEQRRAREAKEAQLRKLRESADPAAYYAQARVLLGRAFVDAVAAAEAALAKLDELTTAQRTIANKANDLGTEIGDANMVHAVDDDERDLLAHVALEHAAIGKRIARALAPRDAVALAELLDVHGRNAGRAAMLKQAFEQYAAEMGHRLKLDALADAPCTRPAWNNEALPAFDAARAALGLTRDAA